MADDERTRPERSRPSERGSNFWPDWLTPRRLAEFVRNVFALERSVSRLQEDNRDLHERMARLQTQMAQNSAQLDLLVDWVKETLSERIDSRAELAVRRFLGERPSRTSRKLRRKDRS